MTYELFPRLTHTYPVGISQETRLRELEARQQAGLRTGRIGMGGQSVETNIKVL